MRYLGVDLYYYDAYGDIDPYIARTRRLAENRAAPTRFEIRQGIGNAIPANARVLGPSFSQSAAAPSTPAGALDLSQGVTSVVIGVPAGAGAGRVRLTVYDLQGRRVSDPLEISIEAGYYVYTWDGSNGRGGRLAPGVYLAMLEAPGFRGTTKLILTR